MSNIKSQSEESLEKNFIKHLQNLNYKYIKIETEVDLKENLKKQKENPAVQKIIQHSCKERST